MKKLLISTFAAAVLVGCSRQDAQNIKELELTNQELSKELNYYRKLYEESTNTIFDLKYGAAAILQSANNLYSDLRYKDALVLIDTIINSRGTSPQYNLAKELKAKILADFKSTLKTKVELFIKSNSYLKAEQHIKDYLEYNNDSEAKDLLNLVKSNINKENELQKILKLMPKKSPSIIELNSNPEKHVSNLYIIQSNSTMGYRGLENYDKATWILKIWDKTDGSAGFFESNDFPFVIENSYFEGLKNVKKGSYFKVIYEVSKAKGKIYGDVFWVSIGNFQWGRPIYHELPTIIPNIWHSIQNGTKINYSNYQDEIFLKMNE
jgi:hypothetical protein